MRKLHLTNAAGRNSRVVFASNKPEAVPNLGLPGENISFKRFVASSESGSEAQLIKEHSDELGQALVDGDPEVDIESVGQTFGSTTTVYLNSDDEVLFAAPEIVEVIYDEFGVEEGRRAPKEIPGNVNDTEPLVWSAMRMPRPKVVRSFSFRRSLQIQHVDGLTYDYLYAMAKELDESDEMVLVGAGSKGRKPLVFQQNGTPYRAFLEGRIKGDNYKLLLHLSNLELKRPKEKQA
jgi:hypothetical protein